jgi:hypothetical protein
MATEKQIEANRINSQKAGVKSEQGKEVIRHNSFKHGLTSKTLLSDLKTIKETNNEFMSIVEGLRSSFKPRNYFEEALIEQMAKAQLKLKRFDVLEAACFSESLNFLDESITLEIRNPAKFELGLKYKISLENQFFRAQESLFKTRQYQQLDLFFPEEN